MGVETIPICQLSLTYRHSHGSEYIKGEEPCVTVKRVCVRRISVYTSRIR
jgi:hypothetical protein